MQSATLNIEVSDTGRCVLVMLAGVLDASNERELRRQVEPLCAAATPHVLLDCSGLDYINSATFGLFFQLHRQCERNGGQLGLFGLKPKTESVMQLLGLHQVLRVYASRAEAESAIPTPSSA